MNTGIYCKQRESSEIHNLILIDEYHKCIFDRPKVEPKDLLSFTAMKTSARSSQEDEKWELGMNVRARFSEDGEYYEAVIEKIFDNEYAVVRFLGYDNQEAVKIEDLRPSRGDEFITKQLEQVEMEAHNNKDDDEIEDDLQKIDWKPGMPCRALYAPNDVIYEATIQEITVPSKKAVVIMAGYGIPFEVSFNDMYESIPDLRMKQENSALKNAVEKKQKPQPHPDVAIPPPLPESKFQRADKPQAELHFSNPAVNSSCISSQYQGMMQPRTENDALACLISSNYLSGYYAGYYDCMKKFQSQHNV